MSARFVEGNLLFEFGALWTKVFRWDRHPAYLDGMGRSHEGKAVDFIGILEDRLPYFIEVKDYRGHTRVDSKGPLEHEFELKFRGTAAALLGAHCREKKDEECIRVFEALIKSQKPWLVLWLEENGPAQKGGLFIGDTIVAVGGTPASDPDDLFAALTSETVGKPIAVEVLRGGKPETVNVTVGERK